MANWDAAAGRLKTAAQWYSSKGWRVLPCHGIVDGRCTCSGTHDEPKDVGKHPSIGQWNIFASTDSNQVATWWNSNEEQNVGVFAQPSGFFVIDIDPRSGGENSYEKFEELVNGSLPPTVEAITGEYSIGGRSARGRHLFYRCDASEQLVGNLKSAGLPGIDIKWNGYVLLAPSRHFSGVCYEWAPGCAPWEIDMAEAPEELLQALRKKGSRSGTSLNDGDWGFMDGLEYGGERVDIDKVLEQGIDEGHRAVEIYRLACALSAKMGVDSEYKRLAVETMMIRFNAEKVRPPMPLEGGNSLLMHVRRAMDWVGSQPPRIDRVMPGLSDWARKSQAESNARMSGAAAHSERTGTSDPDDYESGIHLEILPGTLGGSIHSSVSSGISVAQAFSGNNVDVPKDPDALSEVEGGTPGKRTLTDTGNGRRLIDTFGSAVRYTPGLGWFHWDGTYWKPDVEELEMRELSKRLATVIASEVVNYDDTDKQSEVVKWAQQAKSNGRLSGAIESATSDPRIIVGVDNWDSDVNLLGVANGVIDLRTGELLKGRPDLYITRRAPVAYTPGLRNVRWEQFVDFATGGDKELQDWIQRAAGYSLTGLRTQDVMFLVYGPPGSGKNTFVEAIVKCLGTQQYAWPLDSSILGQGDGQSHGSDLYHWAELRGRRMVWVDELPESERMKENSVKKLTGSSEISARSPGEKPFTFSSQAKLWVTTNHRPIINDEAMWRRLRPIPWMKVPEVSDPDLKAYLFDPEGALPAVLAWAVEGAIKYLGSSARDPLGWCSAISEASDIYRKNEDRIGMFLNEEIKEIPGASLPIKALYAVYRIWSEERGEKPMSQIAFHRKLSDRGNEIVGQGSRAELVGYSLLPRAVPSSEVDWQMANRFAR
jgi:putative DNA primase/helicase